jgi:hypothetical protein
MFWISANFEILFIFGLRLLHLCAFMDRGFSIMFVFILVLALRIQCRHNSFTCIFSDFSFFMIDRLSDLRTVAKRKGVFIMPEAAPPEQGMQYFTFGVEKIDKLHSKRVEKIDKLHSKRVNNLRCIGIPQ